MCQLGLRPNQRMYGALLRAERFLISLLGL